MKKTEKLSRLKEGIKAYITEIRTKDAPMRRRLFDLGFMPGVAVECIMASPLGDPRAYFVGGSVIALRSDDAQNLITEYEV